MKLMICEIGKDGSEHFSLTVCSPDRLAQISPGTFVRDTLVIEVFDWKTIQLRIEKLLLSCESCRDWTELVHQLRGSLHHTDL